MCFGSLVEPFFQRTMVTILTAVADKWWFQEFTADFLLKVLAETIAHGTAAAEGIMPFGMAVGADMGPGAGFTMNTGIVGNPHTANSAKDEMMFDFLGDSRRISGKFISNRAKRFPFA